MVPQLGGGCYGRCWLGGGKGRTYLSIHVLYGVQGAKKGTQEVIPTGLLG